MLTNPHLTHDIYVNLRFDTHKVTFTQHMPVSNVCVFECSQDDKDKERMKAGLSGAILSEKPNVKVRGRQ